MLFLVKIRWDLEKARELADKMSSGEIKEISLWRRDSFYLANDPSVGFDLYEAADEYDLKRKWLLYEPYGRILEIYHVKRVADTLDQI